MSETTRRRTPRIRSGQGLIEYVLIIALASVGLILVLALLRNQIGNGVDNVRNDVQSASGSYYVPGGTPGSGSPGNGSGAGGRGRGAGGPGQGRGGGGGTGGGRATGT